MSGQLNVTFRLRGLLKPDELTGNIVSYCPELDVYAVGHDRPEARRALISTVMLFIRVCYQRQILERVLHRSGFVPSRESAAALSRDGKAFVAVETPIADQPGAFDDSFDVEVPFDLVIAANQEREQACLQ